MMNLSGLFMASQSSIIACGTKNTMVAIGLKVVVGPALMALASIVIGLRNTLFKVAVVQVTSFLFLFCTTFSDHLFKVKCTKYYKLPIIKISFFLKLKC
jgi:hypothetical protein